MAQTNTEASQIKIVQTIAKELNVGGAQVAAAVALLDEGSTVPFIARYRKEVTGNLDDTQLRNLEERLLYLRELEERRGVILASIEDQGKLTDGLRGAVEAAATKQVLEDIYLPYKPKRRTRAQIAIKLFGPDLATLRTKAKEIHVAMSTVPGVVDLQVEPQVGVPQVQINLKRQAAAAVGLSAGDLAEAVDTAFNGAA